jgi:hypothetical protein
MKDDGRRTIGTDERRTTLARFRYVLSRVVPRPSSLVRPKGQRLTSVVKGIALFLVLLISPAAARAELVDRIVASVNNDVITFSEFEQAVAFNVALGGKKEENLRAETLEGLINRRLLIQEAYRLKFVEVSEQDIGAEIEKLKQRLGTDTAFAAFLAKLDMTREQLGLMLGERLLVERFVEKKIGLYVRVSRDEAQDYFNNHPTGFKDKRFPEVQKAITTMLTDRKLEQQVTQYLAELKSKADIRREP